MDRRGLGLLACALAGCYSGGRAETDVKQVWVGRSRAALQARWGNPAQEATAGGGLTALRWSYTRSHIELPSGAASLTVEPGRVEGSFALDTGRVWHSTTVVTALVDGQGRVVAVHGPALRWGPPNDANLRWGVVFGAHAGIGRLDDTATPLPSGGLYIGGMLSPALGLVGTYTMASGIDDDGGAMGFGWGIAAQWWPMTRVWLRAGPALVLAFDPGFEDPSLGPGVTTGLGLAVLRRGTFVLDLRVDAVAAPSGTFGTVGIGVNLN